MNGGTILFNSITWAIRAQKLLEEQGMRTDIRKISKVGVNKGCAYGLDVPKDLQKAVRILKEQGVRMVDVVKT